MGAVNEILSETDKNGKQENAVVIKTTNRTTAYLPVAGFVDAESLRPNDVVGVNKDSYLILDTLPRELDTRVKAMELEERPNVQYSQIGGCDKQIEELREAIVFPLIHKEKFEKIGLQAPKGVLLYGPPGTGKTMLARACAS